MQFRPPPAWLLKFGNPGPFIRPKMRRGLLGLWLPHVGFGGSRLWDISDRARTGTLHDNAVGVASSIGPAWEFDGSSHAFLFDSIVAPGEWASVGNNDDYTLIIAFNGSNSGTDNGTNWAPRTVLWELRQEAGANSDAPFCLGIGPADTNDYLVLGRGSGSGGYAGEEEAGTVTVTGAWHQCCAVVQDDTVNFYVDGIHDVQRTYEDQTGDCSTSSGTVNMTLGSRATDVGGTDDTQGFDGLIGYCAFYHRALSAAEAAALAHDFWGTMFRQPTAAEWVKAAEAAGLSPAVAAYYYRMMRTGGC